MPSSVRSCRSSICPRRLSVAWLVSLSVSSFHNILWSPSGGTRCSSLVFEAVDMPCPGTFHFSHSADYIYDFLYSPWPRCWSFYSCMWCWAYLFPFLSVRPASLLCACLVSVQFYSPYSIAGSTQELYTCLFRQMAMLLLNVSRYAARPAIILRCISFSRGDWWVVIYTACKSLAKWWGCSLAPPTSIWKGGRKIPLLDFLGSSFPPGITNNF